MILSEQGRRPPYEKWAGGFLIFALLGFLFLLWQNRPVRAPAPEKGTYHCTAEQVQGEYFIEDSLRFGGGQTQSSKYAFSGTYSSYLAGNSGNQFGFSFDLSNLQARQQIRSSVWRYEPESQNLGQLVIASEGLFYWAQTLPVERRKSGWQKLELTATIPQGQSTEKVSVYTFSNGQAPVYFDELKVVVLPPVNQLVADLGFKDINLQVKDSNWRKLQQKREEALRLGTLQSDDDDWVKGKLMEADSETPIRLRLKGDWLDHLRADKWSYRVKVRQQGAWNGMRTFSLHTPAARYYLHEWVAHQLLRFSDVLTTRYDFVHLSINGQSKGIYAIEEQFDKVLVESQKRREGPIIRFLEDGFWAAIQKQLTYLGGQNPDIPIGTSDLEADLAQPFQPEKTAANPLLKKLTEEGQQLLAGYLEGSYDPAQVLDLEQLATYIAYCDLLDARHGLAWHNMRFYFNPLSRRLEPIAFDLFEERDPMAERLKPNRSWQLQGMGALSYHPSEASDWMHRLWQDQAFVTPYMDALSNITDQGILQEQLSRLEQGIQNRLDILGTEFPEYTWSSQKLLDRAASIQLMMGSFTKESLRLYRSGPHSAVAVNSHFFPLRVNSYSRSASGVPIPLDTPLVLGGRAYDRDTFRLANVPEQIRTFRQKRAREIQSIPLPVDAQYLYAQAFGTTTDIQIPVQAWKLPFNPSASLAPKLDTLQPHPAYTTAGQTILFKPGRHLISKPLTFPKGFDIQIPPGTTLDFREGAYLLSKSPIQAIGSSDSPIQFISEDETGQGLFISQISAKSHFEHVQFKNLKNLTAAGWQLTGAVTGYEVDVEFKDCLFAYNQSEDALNLIRSTFQLERCVFLETAFDAFDADFCKGSILQCTFRSVGNDGIDASGSTLFIRDTEVFEPGDKGISIGEASEVVLNQIRISGAPIALAAKDQSTVIIQDLRLFDCVQGLAAYQKKPEFGGAQITVKDLKSEQVKRLYAIAPGSKIHWE